MKGSPVSNKTKRHYLPLEQRVQSFKEVLRLRRQGLSYSQIVERIHRHNDVRITTTHVSDWINGKHHPLGSVNKFNAKPSPELAGIIGVALSDGNRYMNNNWSYGIRLEVKDREYAEAFGNDLAKVLRKEKPYKAHWCRDQGRWLTEAHSILLYKFLDCPWQELKPYIEANKTCVARFLKRFSDGDGSIKGRTLRVHNTNRELLVYIEKVLQQYFDIETTGLQKDREAGSRLRDPRNGKVYKRRKTLYYLYIRAGSLPRFHRHIGFTIRRKQRKLIKAIKK